MANYKKRQQHVPRTLSTTGCRAAHQASITELLQQKKHPFINLPLSKESVGTAGIIQAKYYDSSENIVNPRPEETQAIKDARRRQNNTTSLPLTAHHKYPWDFIKKDIETAFQIPKAPDSPTKIADLQTFSGQLFPIDYDTFTYSVSERIRNYTNNETPVDDWIRNVCWVPGNIFLGVNSELRIDDPTKRGEGASLLDAHYTLSRSMSQRSLGISTQGAKYQFGEKDTPKENAVAPYNPAEWGKESMKNFYYQVNDPYFEENVFFFNCTIEPYLVIKDTDNTFPFKLTVSEELSLLNIEIDETINTGTELRTTTKTVIASCTEAPSSTGNKEISIDISIDNNSKIVIKKITLKRGSHEKSLDMGRQIHRVKGSLEVLLQNTSDVSDDLNLDFESLFG